MDSELLHWLERRAEEEKNNISSKKISWLQQFMFTSKEKIAENEKEAAKSLGKIEFIDELLREYIKRKRLDEIQKN